jgi:hypothetical protein
MRETQLKSDEAKTIFKEKMANEWKDDNRVIELITDS